MVFPVGRGGALSVSVAKLEIEGGIRDWQATEAILFMPCWPHTSRGKPSHLATRTFEALAAIKEAEALVQNRERTPMWNTASKKRTRQEDVDSDYLFANAKMEIPIKPYHYQKTVILKIILRDFFSRHFACGDTMRSG
jgi:hypothetical protein